MIEIRTFRGRGERPDPEKWRPVIIRDEEGIRALNALFRRGWYLIDLEMDDLPYLAFQVATAGERPQKSRISGERVLFPLPVDSEKSLLLILTKGKTHRQRALLLDRDEQGYRDFGLYEEQLAREADGWNILQIFSMENRCHLAILEAPPLSPSSPENNEA